MQVPGPLPPYPIGGLAWGPGMCTAHKACRKLLFAGAVPTNAAPGGRRSFQRPAWAKRKSGVPRLLQGWAPGHPQELLSTLPPSAPDDAGEQTSADFSQTEALVIPRREGDAHWRRCFLSSRGVSRAGPDPEPRTPAGGTLDSYLPLPWVHLVPASLLYCLVPRAEVGGAGVKAPAQCQASSWAGPEWAEERTGCSPTAGVAGADSARQTQTSTRARTHTHMHTRGHTHAHIYTCIHEGAQTNQNHAHTHAPTQAHVCTRAHAGTQATCTHTDTHTRTQCGKHHHHLPIRFMHLKRTFRPRVGPHLPHSANLADPGPAGPGPALLLQKQLPPNLRSLGGHRPESLRGLARGGGLPGPWSPGGHTFKTFWSQLPPRWEGLQPQNTSPIVSGD